MIGYGFMGRTHSNAYRKVNNFFDLDYQPGAQGRLRAQCREGARPSPKSGVMNRSRPIGDKLIDAQGHRRDRHRHARTTPHAEIAIAAAKAGKMILCEKPLAMNWREGEKMVAAVEKAKVPNMVWYNYRRVPAVTLAKQLIDEGRLGQDLPLSREVSAGLDDLPGPAAGRRGALAAGRQGRRQRRHRRSARPLHRHRHLAQRRHRLGHRDDRDVHQGAQAQSHRQGREGRHRRCLRVPRALQQRFAGDVRIHPLRPRSQGALHLRNQRRKRLDRVGSARSASPAILRSPGRRQRCAAGVRFTSPTATIRT